MVSETDKFGFASKNEKKTERRLVNKLKIGQIE